MTAAGRTAAALFLLFLPAAAASGAEASAESRRQALAITEKLYLNHKALEEVYQDLRLIAMGYLTAPDTQLNNIQRTYIFIDEANSICRQQWELLSLMDAVRSSHRADYFTLRVKGLKRARDRSRDRVDLITVYRAGLENPAALKQVDAGLALIAGNVYFFEQLIEVLEPLGNRPRPW